MAEQLTIHQVLFGDEWLEIAYQEPREDGDHVKVVRSIAIDPQKYSEEVAELYEQVIELVDQAMLDLRDPPKSIRDRD